MQAPWGTVLQCRPLAAAADHFFTAADLVLRDDPAEWTAVASHAGVDAKDLLLMSQVHGATVAVVSSARPWLRPEADILISDDPTAAIGVRVADCVPILLAEETGRVVGAIHAGWRGLVGRAPIAGVDALRERFGVRPERLMVALGPAAGACCYEVGAEVRQAFVQAGHHSSMIERWFEATGAGKFVLHTELAARDQLEGTGIQPSWIHGSGLCTITHHAVFHSYRAAGARAGRMVGVIRAAGGIRRS